MASRSMRRRAARHRHWILVAACLGVAFAPLSLRRKARATLLDAHARLATLVPGRLATAAEAPGNRVLLLETEVTRLRRALLQAGSASDLVAGDPQAKLIPAEVLPVTGAADILWRIAIDRGEQDGVQVGLPVLADGALVGRVASVTAATAEVLLVADPAFRIRASIARPEGDVEGLLMGTGAAVLRFEPAVLRETSLGPQLVVGETVSSSRASSLCGVPAVLGVVETVERPPGAGSAQGVVRPAIDLTALSRVVVVRVEDDAS